jgi:membrane protein implicated in regulation of membrane protease activity
MAVLRVLAAAAQVFFVVSFGCLLVMFVVPVAFMVFFFLVSEEAMAQALSLVPLTFLALVLVLLVVTAAEGLWRWTRRDRRKPPSVRGSKPAPNSATARRLPQ